MRKCKKQSFSLIELLAVMAIMAVLLTVMLPGFNNMVKGNKVDQLAGKIKLHLEKAQSQAVTSRRHVAVIFPNDTFTDWGQESGQEVRLGGCRLAFVKYTQGSDSCEFVRWVPEEEFSLPVAGAALLNSINKDETNYSGSWSNVPVAKKTGIGNMEDFTLGKNNKTLLQVTNYPTGTRNNCAIVFSPYGEMRNKELKLIVAEAEIADSKVFFPNCGTDGYPTNVVVLKVNQFSGQVEYDTSNL